jgi:FAD/FMN-containing dehydrogenase
LIESVTSLSCVSADGVERQCDPTHNPELFSAVIGGYGLLGIITQATLTTTQNSTYSFSLIPMQTHALIDTLESYSKNPRTRLLEAHLSVDAEHLLSESLIYVYSESDSRATPKDELAGENTTWLRKVVFQLSRASNFGKVVRWEIEKLVGPLVEPATLSRNTGMAVPVRFLQNPDPTTTDILQEYFIPPKQANVFLENYRRLLSKHSIDLLNVTVRKVSKDINALVSYAQEDMYGFVVYYKVQQKSAERERLSSFTRELFDYLLSIKATYYLCYGSYYSPTQLTTMYPNLRTFLALKAQQDPNKLFTSVWFEKYREAMMATWDIRSQK